MYIRKRQRWLSLITERLESFKNAAFAVLFSSLSHRNLLLFGNFFSEFREEFKTEFLRPDVLRWFENWFGQWFVARQPLALSIRKSSEVFSNDALFEQQRKPVNHTLVTDELFTLWFKCITWSFSPLLVARTAHKDTLRIQQRTQTNWCRQGTQKLRKASSSPSLQRWTRLWHDYRQNTFF